MTACWINVSGVIFSLTSHRGKKRNDAWSQVMKDPEVLGLIFFGSVNIERDTANQNLQNLPKKIMSEIQFAL